jgi:hypothetical protein
LVFIEDCEASRRVHPDIQKEIGGFPTSVGAKDGWGKDVCVDTGESVVGPVETTDIVPESGKGEPNRVGSGLQCNLPQDPDGWVEGDLLRQRDLHIRPIQKECLYEDLSTVGGP